MSTTFPRPLLLLTAKGDDVAAALCDPVIASYCEVAASSVSGAVDAAAPDGVLLGDTALSPPPVFPWAAVAPVAGLGDAGARERFLTLVFAAARLRRVRAARAPAGLTSLHADYKYLLQAHDEGGMRELGRMAAASAGDDASYAAHWSRFRAALSRPARPAGHVNALTHMFGHVSRLLERQERDAFLADLREVAAGRLQPGALVPLLCTWAQRFDVPYLLRQAYLQPYPAGAGGAALRSPGVEPA